MSLRPLYDRLVVRLTEGSGTTESGIVLAGNSPYIQCEVVAVGAGHILTDGTQKALTCKVGDTVLLSNRVGEQVVVDGENFIVVAEVDVIGIIE